MKFFIDGVFGSATAMVSEAYLSTGQKGFPVWQAKELRAAIELANYEQFQIHIHAIGDSATELALTILEGLPKDSMKHPPVLIHIELTNDSLISRIRDLGAIACVQPYWAQYNGMLNSCVQHLGDERVSRLYAFKDILEDGVKLAFSSDWPVSTHEPLKGIAIAINRREHQTQTQHNFDQAINLEQAISAYTSGVMGMRKEPVAGLGIGSYFDAVVLDKDLFTLPSLEVQKTKVLATYKAGRKLF